MNLIKFEGYIGDEESVYEGILYIHPFSIEAFLGVEMEFTPAGGKQIISEGVKIYFKSGNVLDIMMDIETFAAKLDMK